MKRLIYVPMLHSPEALAGMSDKIGEMTSKASATHVQGKSDEFWAIVKNRLASLDVKSPRFYLESYTGDTFTVEPNAPTLPLETRTPDEQIMAEFIKRAGGTVEHTEDQTLLGEVFQAYRLAGDATGPLLDYVFSPGEKDLKEIKRLGFELKKHTDRITELHTQRDDYIREVIVNSLQVGEVGVLFLGGKHDAISKLHPDIQIETLDPRLVEILKELEEDERIPETNSEVTGSGSESRF